MDKDRITLAWELRRDLHAWLTESPSAVMAEIFAAFPDRNQSTLRKAINRMRKDGDIGMLGRRGIEGSYSAITASIKPVSAVRANLIIGGLKSVQKMNANNKARHDEARDKARHVARTARRAEQRRKRAERRAENASHHVEQIAPGHTRYHCGHTAPAPDSRGQGSVRRQVYIDCSHNY